MSLSMDERETDKTINRLDAYMSWESSLKISAVYQQ